MPLGGTTTLASEQLNKVTGIVQSKLATVQGWASQAAAAAGTAIAGIGAMPTPKVSITFPGAVSITSPEPPGGANIPTGSVSVSPTSSTYTGSSQISFDGVAAIPVPSYAAGQQIDQRPSPQQVTPQTKYPTVVLNKRPYGPVPPDEKDFVLGVLDPIDVPNPVDFVFSSLKLEELEQFTNDLPDASTSTKYFNNQLDRITEIVTTTKDKFTNVITNFTTAQQDAIVKTYLEDGSATKSLVDGFYSRNRAAQPKRLMEEAASVIDRALVAETQKAMDLWASRNFAIPPGMLIKQVSELEIDAGRKIRAISSKVNTETYQKAKEDFDRILEIYLSIEKNLIDYHLESVRRALEEEKLAVRRQMLLFNSTLDLYKAKQQAANTRIEMYSAFQDSTEKLLSAVPVHYENAFTGLTASDAELQRFKGDVARRAAEANMAAASARTAGAYADAEVSSGLAIKANAESAAANVKAYGDAVRSYAAAVDSASAEFEAYAAEVQAATSAIELNEVNASAYAAYFREYSKANGVYRTFATEQLGVIDAHLQTFREAGEANETYMRAHAAKVSAEAQITSARASAFDNYARGVSVYNKAAAEHNAATMSFSMTSAENAARAASLTNQASIESSKITAGALAAQAQALAGLAQGAMSALHVSASAQGSGATSSSFGSGRSWSATDGGTIQQTDVRVSRLSA